ncbi:MAG: hypothetical protein JWO99_126 [Candidatus Saccharibacteria bacterium]|nr:hypothetical protein [Candidatus Saccharibacteria bacterium]
MKKSNSQTGSAHAIIIILLVVAILGLLGFVFWQNFIQKKDTTPATSTPTTTTTTTTTTTPKTTATSLVLTSYAVEVPYDSSTDTYSVTPVTAGSFAGGYTVYSKKVTDACGVDVNVGKIARFNKGDSTPTPSNTVTIGNYTYALGVGGYGNCSTDAGMTVLTDASTAFSTAFNDLKTSN